MRGRGRQRGRGRRGRRWLWLALVPLGLAMAASGGDALGAAWRLWREGERREAVVIATAVETHRRSSGWDRRRERHLVTYRIALPAGPVVQRHAVEPAFFATLAPGDRVPVVTTLSPPVISEIEGQRRLHDALGRLLAGLVLAGTGLLAFLERSRTPPPGPRGAGSP